METQLTDTEKLLLAREVAADAYEPPTVADEADIRRVPRDSFVAGWDAAMAHIAANRDADDDGYEDDDSTTIKVALAGPTTWNSFVDNLVVRRRYE